MESLIVYIPMDRRQALARGDILPELMQGSALFADISGFTPLTEALAQALGPQHGAEELTRHLNTVYDALINELHSFGGCVIGFSGDAITCWFDGDNGSRATACALQMQRVMQSFTTVELPDGHTATLGMKVSVTSGTARRFLVGDPRVQVIDVISGEIIDNLAVAEHQAQKGDVLLDQPTVQKLQPDLVIREWRKDDLSGQTFAVIDGMGKRIPHSPWAIISPGTIPEEMIVPWLLPPVFSRLKQGRGEFLAELRPAIALFLRFGGIDYDNDRDAARKLDQFIRCIQSILSRYEATLIQLTIGDKGSYLYAAFGAPVAHEDDATRAAAAALEMRSQCANLELIQQVQIGITKGRMRTGAYGGVNRRTYGVLGDAVNLAARLMQAAEPGNILVDHAARIAMSDKFSFGAPVNIQVKGKVESITVFNLIGEKTRQTIRLQEPKYALPMVGRARELAIIHNKIEHVLGGRGQIIGITGEAGIGKSRLIAEIIRIAEEQGLSGYGGECQSYGTNTSYLVWQSIWQAFFSVDPLMSPQEKIQAIQSRLIQIDPRLVPRMPLLAPVLSTPIPDNDLTRSFDAKLRKSSLEALLVDCLRAQANTTPMLIILENCHWLDVLSHDLVEVIGRAIADLSVLIVLAYRPPELERLQSPRLSKIAYFDEIPLTALPQEEIRLLVNQKLDQFFSLQAEIPSELIKSITTRSEGNPFYVEELLNYLRDRNIAPSDSRAIELLDLPSSLHSLVLARIDQRTESQKATLKVASVIGRQFNASWLWRAFDQLGDVDVVKADLEELCNLDITPLDQPEPELTYLFKHIITQEVAYESLPYATRARFHGQLGQFVECCYCEYTDQCVYLLAYHYERSQDEVKAQEYLLNAGDLARATYANEAAIAYYRRALCFLSPVEQVDVMIKLGKVLGLVGRWQEADEIFDQALALAGELGDVRASAWCQVEKADLLGKQGDYGAATQWLHKARTTFEALNDLVGLSQVLHTAGTQHAQQGDIDQARSLYQESLAIRLGQGDQHNAAALLSNLAILARWQGNYDLAMQLNEEALGIRREMDNKWAIAISLSNLGNLAVDQLDYLRARVYLEEAVNIMREVGDRYNLAIMINNLGNAVRAQGDFERSRLLYNESLLINRELGGQWAIAYLLEDMGCLAALQGESERALRLVGAASTLRQGIGAKLSQTEQAKLDQTLEPIMKSLDQVVSHRALEQGGMLSMDMAIQYALDDNWADIQT